ncbi:class I SAM-dependent methyltransferase [Sphingobacterium sp. ML3W]|uniref:class I SAM-dependent methyltransferase n=1 Tax=Sphingobacterium sp. ML3W TaxID=1538644 RepID=UPI00249B885C|nr:class I SAM-dependent methyltransferase [Sphingobacterium sp. ML3W]WFA82137.1 class I SAM-dependent methyltransferase [Sphingobacterium sp. ML3W]
MERFNRKNHWENIYKTKELKETSWYQQTPQTSLDYLSAFNVPVSAKIIDVGGGDSLLVDYLIDLGYEDITVLDISEKAIDRARQRLGDKADKVKWIVEDITHFVPTESYDFWHDRAAFHFLTSEDDIAGYLKKVKENINPDGILVIGTFSEQGPKKCSGIEIKQYSELSLTNQFKDYFNKINCHSVNHRTPSDTTQNFVFCSFRKSAANG